MHAQKSNAVLIVRIPFYDIGDAVSEATYIILWGGFALTSRPTADFVALASLANTAFPFELVAAHLREEWRIQGKTSSVGVSCY